MARVSFGAKPQMFVLPVYIIGSYDKDGKADLMNAAWGGLCGSTRIMMHLSRKHKTVENILETKAFTVSAGESAVLKSCDYVGIVSGNDTPDKIEKSGFTLKRSEIVNAPVVNELSVCLECTLVEYNEQTQCLVGEIVNVSVDERVLTDGRVDPAKVGPISYDPFNNYYLELSGIAGNAFSDGRELR